MKKTILLLSLLWLSFNIQAYNLVAEITNDACGSNTGKIKLTARIDGEYFNTNYLTLSWSNGATTATISNLAAGFYTITATDTGGTQVIETYEVIDDNHITFEANSDISCEFWDEYSIYVNVKNGVAPFHYSLEHFGSTVEGDFYSYYGNIEMIYGAESNNLTITDANGCQNTVYVEMWTIHTDIWTDVQNDCQSSGIGAIVVHIDPPFIGYNLEWSDGFIQNNVTQSISVHDNLFAGNYSLTVTSDIHPNCQLTFSNEVQEMGNNCGMISGKVYADANSDCNYSVNDDVLIPDVILAFGGGEYYTSTNTNGQYSVGLPFGDYSITEAWSNPLVPSCTATQPMEATLSVSSPNVVKNIANESISDPDLSIQMTSNIARPGFPYRQYVHYKNNSFFEINNAEINLSFDPNLTLLSSSLAYDNSTSNSIHWTIPSMGAFEQVNYTIYYQVTANASLIDYNLQTDMQIQFTDSQTDYNNLNNSLTHHSIIQGSYDPNFVELNNQLDQEHVYYLDTMLQYTLHFQNTGTDTAFNITVVDTIPDNLNLMTFSAGAASHAYTYEVQNGRRVEFTFNNINLPPESTNDSLSHGCVSFNIHQSEGNTFGDFIKNKADIFFDFNEAVATEALNTELIKDDPSLNIIENQENDNTFELSPIPAHNFVNIFLEEKNSGLIQIYSISGQLVHELTYENKNTIRIDTQDLDSGVYIVKNKQQNMIDSKRMLIK